MTLHTKYNLKMGQSTLVVFDNYQDKCFKKKLEALLVFFDQVNNLILKK